MAPASRLELGCAQARVAPAGVAARRQLGLADLVDRHIAELLAVEPTQR